MSTVLFPSPVFGPVRSRRLGVSLGINLLPADGKVCTFDCLYCECGLNAERRPAGKMPSRRAVSEALEARLRDMRADGVLPDVLTFAGNGEPTVHPEFAGIIDDTIALRDRLCPAAKVSVLSNATRCGRPEVRSALMKVDNNIQKLDTVDTDFIRMMDRPQGAYSADDVVEWLCAFDGHVKVQTMFLGGTWEGRDADNTGEAFVAPWVAALRRIRPEQVMIYTIDRETPVASLRKAPAETLDGIARRLRGEGFDVSVSY